MAAPARIGTTGLLCRLALVVLVLIVGVVVVAVCGDILCAVCVSLSCSGTDRPRVHSSLGRSLAFIRAWSAHVVPVGAHGCASFVSARVPASVMPPLLKVSALRI